MLPRLRLVTVDTASVCSVAEESFATDSASDVSICSMPGPTPNLEDILHIDRKLADAVLAGELGAFEQLVRKYQDLCWHVIDRMVRHPDDTRELCQETFLRVHKMLYQYRGDSALKSWIAQVAFSVAKRHLERRRIPLADTQQGEEELSIAESVSDGFDLETATSDNQIRAHLFAAIETLPPLQRALLTLYHLEEIQISEIAQITGLAEGTIKSHLFRSRKQLRDVLVLRIGAA
jgi:RNA polymerase sigma factor (sigma-70 family)